MPRKSARQHRKFGIGDIISGRRMTPKQRRRSNKGKGGIAIIGGFRKGLPVGVRHKK